MPKFSPSRAAYLAEMMWRASVTYGQDLEKESQGQGARLIPWNALKDPAKKAIIHGMTIALESSGDPEGQVWQLVLRDDGEAVLRYQPDDRYDIILLKGENLRTTHPFQPRFRQQSLGLPCDSLEIAKMVCAHRARDMAEFVPSDEAGPSTEEKAQE